ncbi:GNAT family N-acetyltransferase [Kineosporia succinea]|uniref:RimJ/RimL family protein N-acetyltransferase n=1 Tax=Kineosporia succinea TaxID=84632 RepID=A0ABT9PCF8_9ACTN|nr:GNAT family N-acetyltransferase [Kineosporia succinea]MDP9830391.1 RimJ/RimL family protein N-acetyltransferase [Kineosporia succinea]
MRARVLDRSDGPPALPRDGYGWGSRSPEERTITTARVTVRRFAPGDLDDFLTYQSDPVVRAHLPGEPMSAGAAAGFLARQADLDERQTDAWHAFAVHHPGDDRVIGDVGVWLAADRPGTGDIGFQFAPAYHGQGYAREAMQQFLPYLFETLDLGEVTAGCDSVNRASWGLMRRLGMELMTDDGTVRRYRLRAGTWRDQP